MSRNEHENNRQQLDQLRQRHQKLEQEIQAEANRPSPNEESLSALKRERLSLKEEISRLSAE